MMARLLFIFSLLLQALPAAAGEGPSVVVIEGISLPDHLDAFHARARRRLAGLDFVRGLAADGSWDLVPLAGAGDLAALIKDATGAAPCP